MAILVALSSWSYIESWARNKEWLEGFYPLHLVVWSSIFLVIGALAGLLTYRLAKSPRRVDKAYAMAAITLVLVQSWSSVEQIDDQLSSAIGQVPAALVMTTLAGLVIVAVARVVPAFPGIRAVFGILTAALVGAHIFSAVLFTTQTILSDRPLDVVLESVPADPAADGDILVIVLDEYGRSDVLLDVFGYDNSGFESALNTLGLQVVPFATANYTASLLSVGGLLDGRYPTFESLDGSEILRVESLHSGNNAMFESLHLAGYETHLFDNAWAMTRCGANVDVCHPATMNELDGVVGQRSVLPTFFPHLRIDPWIRESISQLKEAAELLRMHSQQSRLIYVHALIPHAPFQVRSDCQPYRDERFDGYVVDGSVDQATLMTAYNEQVSCVNSLVLDVLEATSADTQIFVTGDHGPRWAGVDPARNPTADERDVLIPIGIFTAYRFAEACDDIPPRSSLMQSAGYLFDCLGIEYRGPSANRPDQPARYFSYRKTDGMEGIDVFDVTPFVSGLR